jgi:hypothetical protein
MSKDLDESVDKLEAATDPNTVISIGGYNFTPAKLMIARSYLPFSVVFTVPLKFIKITCQ